MTLEDWRRNGWLQTHRTSREEVRGLLGIVRRDLEDAGGAISPDWRFGIAYNAALKLCTLLLAASGYRPAHTAHHYRALASLPLILGPERREDADYLETCRRKRNEADYIVAGGVTEVDAEELRDFARGLMKDARAWLTENHPELLGE
ncbi:MAG: hypothetical protein JW958_00160 [Candidatus Eisenbacteria bacterium]|nr:hypothetical protein [Candidatus Eisenbacteria bacterium]